MLKLRDTPRLSVTGSEGTPKDVALGEATQRAVDLVGDIKSLERTRIADALERCGGNQSRAAEVLGISRGTLIARLAEFGLPPAAQAAQ